MTVSKEDDAFGAAFSTFSAAKDGELVELDRDDATDADAGSDESGAEDAGAATAEADESAELGSAEASEDAEDAPGHADTAEAEEAGGEDTADEAGPPQDVAETAEATKTAKTGENFKGSDPDEDLLNRLAGLIKEAPAKKDTSAAGEAAKAPPEAPQEPELYTDDEKALLDEYRKDWPDVAKAEALTRRQEYHQLVNYIFQQVVAELTPVMQTVQTLAERVHFDDLTSRVEDYDTVREDVINWVETQPKYLQGAYNDVIQNGTAEEVADLIDRYRAETQAPTTTAAPTPLKEPELPAEAKKAAASLAPVSSKRSRVAQKDGVDKDDFDGAFQLFARNG